MNGARALFVRSVVGVVLIGVIAVSAWSYVAPFLFALLLAALIDPFVVRLHEALPVGRGVAVIIVLATFLTLFVGAFGLIVANVAVELDELLTTLPAYGRQVGAYLDAGLQWIRQWADWLPPPLVEAFTIDADEIARGAATVAKNALLALGKAPRTAFIVFIAVLATFFISRDRHALWASVLRVLPREWRPQIVKGRDEIIGGVLGLLRAQFILVGITVVISVIGLAVLRVPYAWGLGLLAGLFDLAPVVGPGGVFVPVAFAYALQGRVFRAVAVGALWLCLFLSRQFLEPQIYGTELGLHPVTMLVAVYVGVRAAGMAGFIIGPLALIVIKAFFVVTVLPELPQR